MQIVDGIPVYGSPIDPGALRQVKRCIEGLDAQAALMADHHTGYSAPIGGVLAYRGKISPSGVGFDIACGNKAVRTDLTLSRLAPFVNEIMDQIVAEISFGVGLENRTPISCELFDDRSDSAWTIPFVSSLKDLASSQLGTVGGGNHFIDLLIDSEERVWVGVHFGSRGFGHRIASHYIKLGGGGSGVDAPPVLFDLGSSLGQEFLAAMRLAGRYAYAGRDWVCRKVVSLLGGSIVEEVHNHHNFAWIENHFGEDWCVIRKGATPAFPGQKGFVGGSMGDCSVIIEGVESPASKEIFYSTVHGAGRIMSRTQAKGRGRANVGGKVSREMMEAWIRERGVVLRGGGRDESPHCYRRLEQVLAEHAGTIKVLHILRPIGVAMAGEDEVDRL